MELDVVWILTLFAIGFVGSFISGMVGIGGSIIKYPMLLYIPPALGFIAFTAQEVAAVRAVQVFLATLAGIFAYRKGNFINKKLVLYMGIPIMKLVACTMTINLLGLQKEELIDGIDYAGVAAYLGDAPDAKVNLFI